MRRIVLSSLGLWMLLLGGCGFQLRGQAQLPPELSVVYLQSQTAIGTPPGALSRKLRLLLANNGWMVESGPGISCWLWASGGTWSCKAPGSP